MPPQKSNQNATSDATKVTPRSTNRVVPVVEGNGAQAITSKTTQPSTTKTTKPSTTQPSTSKTAQPGTKTTQPNTSKTAQPSTSKPAQPGTKTTQPSTSKTTQPSTKAAQPSTKAGQASSTKTAQASKKTAQGGTQTTTGTPTTTTQAGTTTQSAQVSSQNADGTWNAFFYGSLMVPDIFHSVVYRSKNIPQAIKDRHTWRPAILHGYMRRRVMDAEYPGIVKHKDHNVVGTLITGLKPSALEQLDYYEGDEYERKTLTVSLLDKVGNEKGEGRVEGAKMGAEVYVFLHPAELETQDWSLEEFCREMAKLEPR